MAIDPSPTHRPPNRRPVSDMSLDGLPALHGRYTALSQRFRSAWAFHQYVESLRKVFMEGAPLRLPVDFQEVYTRLKGISQRLNAAQAGRVQEELDSVERQLEKLSAALLDEDNKVSPALLRQFFQRVKNRDDKILTQLVKFYVYGLAREGALAAPPGEDRLSEVQHDQLDKVDFLITKLAEERDGSGHYSTVERGRLRELATGLWLLVEAQGEPPPQELEAVRQEIGAIRNRVASSASLDALNEHQLVSRYRELKHTLGGRFFHPVLLPPLIETNLVFKNLIRQLYSLEERRIVAEYQRVFELERSVVVDRELDAELARFKDDVERFEAQLQREELKLEDLAQIRGQIRSLTERLTGGAAEPGAPDDAPGGSGEVSDQTPSAETPEILAEPLERLQGALEAVDPALPPRQVALSSEIFSLRIEPREVVAFRRLQGPGQDKGRDLALERFLLEAAALRVRLNEEVEEIKALLDETAVTGEAPTFQRARRAVRLASIFLGRFEEAVERYTLAGQASEAQALMILRMRLLRDYSGAWLLIEKRQLARRGVNV